MKKLFFTGLVFSLGWGIFTISQIAEDRSPEEFTKSFYILLNEKKVTNLPNEDDLIYSSLRFQANGGFSNRIPDSIVLRRILIAGGSSKASDWKRESFRKTFLMEIEKILKTHPGLKEVQFDFEGYPAQNKKEFSDFVKYSKEELSRLQIKTSVALFPPNHPDNNGFHDWNLMKDSSDYFYVMMYDMHNPRTKPGHITDSKWIDDNLNSILKAVGKDNTHFTSKMILGLPLYGYSWNSKGKYLKVYHRSRIKAVEEAPLSGLVWKKSNEETVYMASNLLLDYWEKEAQKRGLKGVVYWRWGF